MLENPVSPIASVHGSPEMILTKRIQGNYTFPVAADSCDQVSDTKWNKEEATHKSAKNFALRITEKFALASSSTDNNCGKS